MMSKLLSASALLLLSNMAAAQTSSACNPVKGDKCAADPAFGGTYNIDFTKGASKYISVSDGTSLTYDTSKGAAFSIGKESDAPTVSSTKYAFFGTVDVTLQAAPGTGVITSIVLQSDDLDEIDWEFLGGNTTTVQTNYYSKGNTTTYGRGGYHAVTNPQSEFHTYSIDFSSTAVIWSIDGVEVRRITPETVDPDYGFPQTPMQLKLGTWDAGASTEPKGTVEWAGGYTPFGNGNGPYVAYYKNVKITDKSNGVSGATSYSYSGTSGTYESIKVNTDGTSGSDSSSSATGTSTTTTKTTGTKGTTTATSASASGTAATTLTKATTTPTSGSTTTTTTSSANGTFVVGTTTSTATSAANGLGLAAANLAGLAVAALASYMLL